MDEIHPFEMLNLYTQKKTSTNNVREIDANAKQGDRASGSSNTFSYLSFCKNKRNILKMLDY